MTPPRDPGDPSEGLGRDETIVFFVVYGVAGVLALALLLLTR